MSMASVGSRPDTQIPPMSGWLRDLYRELRRGRHVILHGAVADRVRFGSEYLGMRDALCRFLPMAGVEVVAAYDPVDGLTFPDAATADRFHALRQRGVAAPADEGRVAASPASSGAGAGASARAQRMDAAETQMASLHDGQRGPRIMRPDDALHTIRAVLSRPDAHSAAVVDLLDLVVDRSLHSRDERNLYAQMMVVMREAATHPVDPAAPLAPARNPLVLVVGDLSRVPHWLYDKESPLVACVRVAEPSTAERADFFVRHARDFYGGDLLDASKVQASAESLAVLTDGMTNWDLEALRRSSHVYQSPMGEPRQLVHLHVHGPRRDPWSALKFDPASARAQLRRRVIGQDAAVDTAVDVLNAANVGIGFEGQDVQATSPRGVFFFVGPTGTGKTELAKAIAELVFGDAGAVLRIDMSEYRQEHAADRLVGSPPGFVGHEQGGVLTNALLLNPFQVVLFDEVEKAHPGVLDSFLQMLEDGRLTDGLGRTARFNQALLIFTSNEGSAGLHRLISRDGILPSYADVRDHYVAAVKEKLSVELRRPELLGRFADGIIVFDILRPEVMGPITSKFLALLAASAHARYGVTVRFDDRQITGAVMAAIERDGSQGSGGRQIKTEVDRLVRRPLAAWWSAHWPARGETVAVAFPEDAASAEIALLAPAP